MKVRTFINTLNKRDVLNGSIRFKLLTNDGKYGDKWLFWYEKQNHEGKDIKTINDFLDDSCEGLLKAIDSYIDFNEFTPIEVVICGNGDTRYDILYTIHYTNRR